MKKIISFLFISFFFYSTTLVFATGKITLKRMEPASWWIGMKNPNLQLLVYGNDIGLTDAKINIQGVTLKGTEKVENKNYLFVDLSISDQAIPGNYPIEFIKDGKKVLKVFFQLNKRGNNSAQRKSYDASDVIYLLMPDRFSNGDPNNDSVKGLYEKVNLSDPNGRHGGDIQGIINHLDYLKNSGFSALWITPLLEDNMQTYSYHTYAITDYYRIDPRYGTNADYARLADEMHKRNMKLIMDVVTNHCGSNHYWMADLPTKDWVHQFKNYTHCNFRIPSVYDPYASEADRNLNYNGWFDTTMPDLNQDNPYLLTYLTQNTIWWVEYAGLDGLRIDTHPYNSTKSLPRLVKAVREEYPNINIVGENTIHTSQEMAYWQTGSKNYDGYDSQLPAVMDFPLQDVFASCFDGWLEGFYNHFALDYIVPDPNNLLVFTENHDTQRFNEIINNDLTKYKMAYTVLFTIRGIPQFYTGSEIMMKGDKLKGDGYIRQDFPGGWPNDSRNAFTEEGRTQQENESYHFIYKLLNWRKSNPVICSGKTMQFAPEDNMYVYFRYNNDKTVMVILNGNSKAQNLDTQRFAERINGFNSGYDIISEKKINNLSVISVPAKTSMIIELSKN